MAKASQFLKLVDKQGQLVEGECFDPRHAKEINLTGWNWGVEDPAATKSKDSAADKDAAAAKVKSTRPGAGGDTGDNINPAKFSLAKQTDRSTVRLINAIDNGEVFPTALLTIVEQFEEAPTPFEMKIELSDVYFVDFRWNANAGSAGFEFDESWDLNYSNIKFSYNWRGKPAAWIDVDFERRPDSTEGASKKSPLSAAEKKAADRKLLEDFEKEQQKKRKAGK